MGVQHVILQLNHLFKAYGGCYMYKLVIVDDEAVMRYGLSKVVKW